MPMTVSVAMPAFGTRYQSAAAMAPTPRFGTIRPEDIVAVGNAAHHTADRIDRAWFNLKSRFTPLDKATFTVIDTETTGLDPATSQLIEITAIQYKNGKEVGKFTSLVNPHTPIPQKIQELTHITDEMVSDAPELKDVLQDFVKFVGKQPIIVGHYVNFDLNQIQHRLDQAGMADEKRRFSLSKAICTKTLGQVVLPELKLHQISGSLVALGKHLGIVNENPHRSESDVRTTGEVLFALNAKAQASGAKLRSLHDLMEYQGAPITEYSGQPAVAQT